MRNDPIVWKLVRRLEDDGSLGSGARSHIFRALDEPEGGGSEGESEAPGVFLRRLSVRGFRGIGPEAKLSVFSGPGITLVVGRNGSGKSSFAEGLETLLSGQSLRWKDRKPARDWEAGWRNLHATDAPRLEALFESGPDRITVARRWGVADGLGNSSLSVRRGADSVAGGLEELGWADALTVMRPFLSYNELSTILSERPTKLYEKLDGLLGLSVVAEARELVAEQRRGIERLKKQVNESKRDLRTRLADVDDPRARDAEALLGKRTPDLFALVDAIGEVGESKSGTEVEKLRRLAGLELPKDETVLVAADRVRAAVGEVARLTTTDEGREAALADLLERALSYMEAGEGHTCPVCETPGVLDDDWQDRATSSISELRGRAGAVRTARKELEDSVRAAMAMANQVVSVPDEVGLAEVVAARQAREEWGRLPQDPEFLAAHLEASFDPLVSTFEALKGAALERLKVVQDAWRPCRNAVEDWIEEAHALRERLADLADLKEAEDWLKAAEDEMREEAFLPIQQQIQETWNALKQSSNVDIAGLRLQGSHTRRKLVMDVTVDDVDGVALGVMSQGELNALALSLFVPRLLASRSPFRFALIDDPVQAMDPAKVEGLARVLEQVAKTHQVIVFTHDDRLPEAVWRLGIDASVVRVDRRPGSVVETQVLRDTSDQLIADAFYTVEHSRLPRNVAERVVPGLCRSAVEIILKRAAFTSLRKQGEDLPTISQRIHEAKSTRDLAALGIYGSTRRAGDVGRWLENKLGRWAPGVFRNIVQNTHGGFSGNLLQFVRDAERLRDAVAERT